MHLSECNLRIFIFPLLHAIYDEMQRFLFQFYKLLILINAHDALYSVPYMHSYCLLGRWDTSLSWTRLKTGIMHLPRNILLFYDCTCFFARVRHARLLLTKIHLIKLLNLFVQKDSFSFLDNSKQLSLSNRLFLIEHRLIILLTLILIGPTQES